MSSVSSTTRRPDWPIPESAPDDVPATDDTLIPRHATKQVATALADTPVVMVNGLRQCGKTTLVRGFAADGRRYISLDDETAPTAARDDPAGFLRPLDRAIVDEVQRAPELLRAIKLSVDQDRRPGRYLLTGSADLLTLPTVSDSRAGRMEIVTLLPLSQAEIGRTAGRFVGKVLAGMLPQPSEVTTDGKLAQRVLRGGNPEMLRRADLAWRRNWARDYIAAIVQRDVRDVAAVERLDAHAPTAAYPGTALGAIDQLHADRRSDWPRRQDDPQVPRRAGCPAGCNAGARGRRSRHSRRSARDLYIHRGAQDGDGL